MNDEILTTGDDPMSKHPRTIKIVWSLANKFNLGAKVKSTKDKQMREHSPGGKAPAEFLVVAVDAFPANHGEILYDVMLTATKDDLNPIVLRRVKESRLEEW